MKRIQRKRTQGYRMPKNAKYVGRPTRWGNPFDWRDYLGFRTTKRQARQWAVDDYRRWLDGKIRQWPGARHRTLEHLEELRGFDLACWCELSDACHADILIELLEETQR
jgi:hypothetical protein